MYPALALAVLIFSIFPAATQAGPVPGSQSVTIGISLAVLPKQDDEGRLIDACVAATDQEAPLKHSVTCRNNVFSVRVVDRPGRVAVRVIPI